MRRAGVIALIGSVLAGACAGKNPAVALPAVATDGCPAVLLTRSGGLGFETQGGVLAAVWPSGTIIRAGEMTPPGRYMIGRLSAADTQALREFAESSKTWEQPLGQAVLDMPDDVLTLRRGQEFRQWTQTPGFTSSATVEEFRTRLFALTIEGARGFRQSLKDVYDCSIRR